MRVAGDIGGTFTDLIYLDEITGETGMTKASVPLPITLLLVWKTL